MGIIFFVFGNLAQPSVISNSFLNYKDFSLHSFELFMSLHTSYQGYLWYKNQWFIELLKMTIYKKVAVFLGYVIVVKNKISFLSQYDC